MTPEGKVKTALKKALKDLGAWQYWPVSNGMGVHGIPDCIGCYQGKFFGVEVKAPGRRGQLNRGCSALQMKQAKEIREAGGLWAVVDCAEEINELIEILRGL